MLAGLLSVVCNHLNGTWYVRAHFLTLHTVCACMCVLLMIVCPHVSRPAEPFCTIYAEEDGTGVNITAAAANRQPHLITQLRNHSLPVTGCEPNYEQCDLRCFTCGEIDGDPSYCCTLPVVNSTGGNALALLQLQWSASHEQTPRVLQLQNQTIISHNEDCVMAHTFDREQGDRFVSCINTTASTTSHFAFIWFLDIVHEGSSTLGFRGRQYTDFGEFPGPLSLSETRYVQSSYGDCQYPDNVFFVASSQGYTTNVRDSNIVIASHWNITDCWYPTDVSYVRTNRLLLRVQCSQYITKLVTACGSHMTVESYDSRVNGTMYQCGVARVAGVAGTEVRVNLTLGDELIWFTATEDLPLFENISVSHPFHLTSNISYGFCEVGNDLTFIFALNNGSVLSLSFITGNISTLAHTSCTGSTDTYTRGQCYKARKASVPGLVIAYDHHNSNFVVANLSCPDDPVVGRVPVHPMPPLAGFVGGSDLTCRDSPEPTNVVGASPKPTNVVQKPTDTTERTESPKFEFLGFLAILIIVVVVVVVAISYWKQRRKKSLADIASKMNHVVRLLPTAPSISTVGEGASESEFHSPDEGSKSPSPPPHSPVELETGPHSNTSGGNGGGVLPSDNPGRLDTVGDDTPHIAPLDSSPGLVKHGPTKPPLQAPSASASPAQQSSDTDSHSTEDSSNTTSDTHTRLAPRNKSSEAALLPPYSQNLTARSSPSLNFPQHTQQMRVSPFHLMTPRPDSHLQRPDLRSFR